MPVYEYRCRACNHRFSRLQRVGADAAEVSCPSCGRRESEREISTFASGSTGASAGAGSGACGSGGFT